jgi:hypothetical protein
MPYEAILRHEDGRLRLPFADLPMLLYFHGFQVGPDERPALENMTQFVVTMAILARRLRDCLSEYEKDTWVNVPFHLLFVDTQSLVLFLRQFMEDASFVIRAALPAQVRGQMPAGFTDLSARITGSGPGRDPALAAVCPPEDPLRAFLVEEQNWLREVKDLRDDICHRSVYGRLRTARFPKFIDLIRAGGGKAPFASGADLRDYLCGVFQRWLAFAHVVGEFVTRRVKAEHADRTFSTPGGLIVADGELDVTVVSDKPLVPLGTTIMTLSRDSIDSLEYFLNAPPNMARTPSENLR